jgi:hypothetical protein
MKSLGFLVLTILAFALAAKPGENGPQIASATFPSMVRLVGEDDNGQSCLLAVVFS